MTSPKGSKTNRRHNTDSILSTWRAFNNYSQQEAASLIGITQAAYSLLERGLRRPSAPVKLTIKRLMTGQIQPDLR